MKICNYCDMNCGDEEMRCPSCGASDFRYRCSNCGTIFTKEGACPNCGVRIGQKPRRCPRCGTEYYGATCSGCGYSPAARPYASSYSTMPDVSRSAPKKSRSATVLWVLGWIYCFPIPLTVLIWKSKKLTKNSKIVLTVLVWVFLLFFAAVTQ